MNVDLGDCIQNINTTTFDEVWACDATENNEIVIHDLSGTGDLTYWLDLEGTNIKGVSGAPPDGGTDIGSTFWVFDVPDYTVVSPDVPGCEVRRTLQFTLSEFQNIYSWKE